MTKPIDQDILKAAGKINDGEQIISDIDMSTDQTKHKIWLALQQIDQVTRKIRKHSEVNSLHMKQGDHWAHLQIIKKIGHGGIGEVYRAYDSVLDCDVAVKFLNQKSQLYIKQEQFLQEARNMAKVRHPHVLAIHGATIEDNIAGYWGDYLDGELLSHYIEKKTTNWDQKFTYIKQLCQAVKAIHSNQLVHGDIKAPNVMLQPQRGAILLDFGSSKINTATESQGNKHLQLATPTSMAPEQFLGSQINNSSDIFSLGVLFWHLTTSEHPFAGMDFETIKLQSVQLLTQDKKLKGSKQWKNLILDMVNPDADQRPDINTVERTLKTISQKPLQKARKMAFVSAVALAFGIALISMYSNYKTQKANNETMALNHVLTNVLMKTSPAEEEKGLLSIDTLGEVQQLILSANTLSEKQKYDSLMQLVNAYELQGKEQNVLELTDTLLSKNISQPMRLELLYKQSTVLMKTDKQRALSLLQQVADIKPETAYGYSLQTDALLKLIDTQIKSHQMTDVPHLIEKTNLSWNKTQQDLKTKAKIQLLEGNVHELNHEYQKALLYYEKALSNHQKHSHKKSPHVLIAKGTAAAALAQIKATETQGLKQLEKVLIEISLLYGLSHNNTLAVRIFLSDLYSKLGKPKKSLSILLPFLHDFYKNYQQEKALHLKAELRILKNYLETQNDEKAKTFLSMMKQRPHSKHLSQTIDILEKTMKKGEITDAINHITTVLKKDTIPFNHIITTQEKHDMSDKINPPQADHSIRTNDEQDMQVWNMDMIGIPGLSSAYDNFGRTLATGDFNADGFLDVAIGIPNYDFKSIYSGAVLILYGTHNGLSTQDAHFIFQTENSGKSENYDAFGSSMISGNFNGDSYDDLAVGSPFENLETGDNKSPSQIYENAGAVNVFYGTKSGLSTQSTFLHEATNQPHHGNNTAQAHANFGWSLTAGDFNQDGKDELLVSAPQKNLTIGNQSFSNAGLVYMFYGSPEGISHDMKTTISQYTISNLEAPENFDQFGWKLDHGDFNNDGHADLVIGVPYESIGAFQFSGIVQVIYGNKQGLSTKNQTWTQQENIAGFVEDNDFFGYTTAVGDFDGDSIDDLLIGVPGEDYYASGVNNGGVAHIVFGSVSGLISEGNQIIQQNASEHSDKAEDNDMFGISMDFFDTNKDGYDDLIIGVPAEDIGNNSNSGLVHVFFGNPTRHIGEEKNYYFCTQPHANCGAAFVAGNVNKSPSLIFSMPGMMSKDNDLQAGEIVEIKFAK